MSFLSVTGCSGAIDIVYVVDSSGSIEYAGRGNWNNTIKGFLRKLTQTLQANNVDGTYSIVNFASRAIIDTYFVSSSQALSRINSLQYQGTKTNINDALDKSELSLSHSSNRPSVGDIVILITDGEPTVNVGGEVGDANLIKATQYRGQYPRIITVGIGQTGYESELRAIASQKSNGGSDYFAIDDFNLLNAEIKNIVTSVCVTRAPPPTPAPTPVPGKTDQLYVMLLLHVVI